MEDVSIIIPSYNEAENLPLLVNKIELAMQHCKHAYDIWFIDDSTDNTARVLEKIAANNKHVNFICRKINSGLGTAVAEGFRHSQGSYLIVMDADLQHPPILLPTIIDALKHIDIVIPSRFISGGSDGGLSYFRKLISKTARIIGQLAIKRFRTISDCTSGYFGVKRCVINNINFNPISWKILMEILVKGNYVSVKEIPYQFLARDAGTSKMNFLQQWKYLRHILQLAFFKK